MLRFAIGFVGLVLLIGGIYLMQSVGRTDDFISFLQTFGGLGCVAAGCHMTLSGFFPSVIGSHL